VLHETSSLSAQAWSVLNGITHSYLPPTRFIPARAEPHLVIYIRNLGANEACLESIVITHIRTDMNVWKTRVTTALRIATNNTENQQTC